MTAKHLGLLLLAFVACAIAQSDDELHIPMENDNQFPPDHHSDTDGSVIEGSGLGAIEEPIETTTQPAIPIVEDVQLTSLLDNQEPAAEVDDSSCPKPCVCNIEGDTNNYVVDCSGYGLTELPKPIDERTTKLNLHNNKLTEIPKDIQTLKNLQVLNANDNLIMELATGSISNLPELTTLNLANNRLIEFPKDLKNSFSLTKLQELDLGGNDMRTSLTPESFANFQSLRKLTLPTSSSQLLDNLCVSLKSTLETVCTGSCSDQQYECPDAPSFIDEEMLEAILPGTIALSAILEDSIDPILNSHSSEKAEITTDESKKLTQSNVESPAAVLPETIPSSADKGQEAVTNESPALHSAMKSDNDAVSQSSAAVETPKAVKPIPAESDVNVGATTSDSKTGGVDKSVIGIIVAGMVLVVAGITIKKNWSSIKNKFSSNQRTPNERSGPNVNGTAPEEVPLQEKSPV